MTTVTLVIISGWELDEEYIVAKNKEAALNALYEYTKQMWAEMWEQEMPNTRDEVLRAFFDGGEYDYVIIEDQPLWE